MITTFIHVSLNQNSQCLQIDLKNFFTKKNIQKQINQSEGWKFKFDFQAQIGS